LGRWLADTPEGRAICRRWKEWVASQVKKYDWDIDPDDAAHADHSWLGAHRPS